MSGSSLDGVDVVSCTFYYEGTSLKEWSLDKSQFFELNQLLKTRISNFKTLDPIGIKKLDLDLGKFFGQCIKEHAKGNLISTDVVGVHGQTIYHLPKEKLTCQLGNGMALHTELQVPIVCDFRTKDILAGGVGTPMAPLADENLFSGHDFYLNLGGIANISFKNEKEEWIAYDVCPFNQFTNHYAAKLDLPFDKDGKLGGIGVSKDPMVQQLLSYPYFSMKPPKSLDNNWIVESFIPNAEKLGYSEKDALSSFYNFAVTAVCSTINTIPKEGKRSMLVTGGGAYNGYFIELLGEKLASKGVNVVIPTKDIIDYKEALLIALAASFKCIGKPNFYSSVTGARESVCGGVLYN